MHLIRPLLAVMAIYPLSPLTELEAQSALVQVANAVHTFGTSYTSTGLSYGGR